MRKKIAVGVGLVVMVNAGIVLMGWWITPAPPAELPLRVGMTVKEVADEFGSLTFAAGSPQWGYQYILITNPDSSGISVTYKVIFDGNDRVTSWERQSWKSVGR